MNLPLDRTPKSMVFKISFLNKNKMNYYPEKRAAWLKYEFSY